MCRAGWTLADPALHSLAVWLRRRRVDLTQLQAVIDELLGQVQQAALQEK